MQSWAKELPGAATLILIMRYRRSSELVDPDSPVQFSWLGFVNREIEELDGALQELRSTHNLAEFESYAPPGEPEPPDDGGDDEPCRHHHSHHYYDQQQPQHWRIDPDGADSSGSWPRKGSAELSDSEDNDDDELDSNGSAVKQRRCLCVFIGVVIVVFVLAAVLGASLAFQQQQHPAAQ